MQYEDKKALSTARLNNATECLDAAKSLLDDENTKVLLTALITQSFML